jgi:prophage regulatory protein
MKSNFVHIKLPAKLDQRLSAIAEAGILGNTIEEVLAHFTREALHRDWLAQEVIRERMPVVSVQVPVSTKDPSPEKKAATTNSAEGKRMLRFPEVRSRVGCGKSNIYRMVAEGTFPAPKRLSARTIGWLESEVDAWIESRGR